ncbi:MAG TPA: hypothetical protein P5112_04925 [Bacteroidales bacterium]|nr:hypothetical protein [Bacteroidales bacterium]
MTDINQQDNNSIQNDSDSIIPDEIKDKIELARKATRKGNFTQSTRIWKTIRDFSLNTDDKKLTIRANLEIALSMVRDDRHDLENPLKIANDCLNESKKVNLGNQKGRVLQILGEIHRLKGNIDQARGFQNASIEYSKEKGEKDIEAWTYLSMSLLSKSIKEPIDIQLGYVKQAYDAFTNLQITSKDNNNENTISGYAACHTLRADIFGYNQFDNAISEYSLALSLYKQLGKSWEYDLGKIYLERGEMQIMRDDFEQGVQDLINAEKIFTKLRNHYMAAKCIMACAELLDKRGARTESEKYFKSAFLKVSLVKDEHKQSWFYFRYAMKLLELGEHDSAKQILLVLLSRKSTTDSQKLDVLKTLSDLAKILKDDDELLQYEEYSLSIIEKLIYEAIKPNEKLKLIIKKAQAYEGLKKYELALETFDRAIKLSESLQTKDALADCWASKAQVYGFMDNKVEERKAYEYVITLIGEDNESPQLITTLTMLAQIEVKESNFNKAREFLDKAEILCKNVMPFMLFVINDIRSRLAEAEGNQIKKE